MKRRGFGYRAPSREHQKERANSEFVSAGRRAAEDDEPVVVERKQTEPDMRSLAQRIGLPEGCDLDAELARRKEVAIANLASSETMASERRAQYVASQNGLDETTQRIYALMLRSCELFRPRQTSVAVVDRNSRERFNVPLETTGPGGPPSGFTYLYPNNILVEHILGLPPPVPATLLSPTLVPPLTPQQRLEAARLMDRTLERLEAIDFVRRGPGWALLRL
jgi:hypothetical protein